MDQKQFYYKNNRIQQLRGFCYTVQAKTISDAAKKMGLTQSAVTLQIQSLERDLGVKVFEKDGKKMRLTHAGKNLYAQSIYYVQGIEDLFERFIEYSSQTKNNAINLATNHACISYILPKYIKKFKEANPGVTFHIRNLSRQECEKRLLNGEIDMFIYPIDLDGVPDEFDFLPITTYQPILLTHKDHPLAKKKNISLSDISHYELLRIDPHLITLPAFEELLKANNIKSTIEFEMSDWEILKKFVKAQIGVAMISNIILEGENETELVQHDLTKYFPKMTYGIFVKKGSLVQSMSGEFISLLTTETLLDSQC